MCYTLNAKHLNPKAGREEVLGPTAIYDLGMFTAEGMDHVRKRIPVISE